MSFSCAHVFCTHYLFKKGSELLVVMLRASWPMPGEDTGFWVPPSCSMLVGSWFLRASSCMYAKKKKRNVCQSAKFTKWADWVCRKGSLTEDDINHLLWNCSKYRDESGCIFQPKKKDRTNYTGFAFKARTQNSEWGVGKEKNPTNLTYKFHLVSCITLLC